MVTHLKMRSHQTSKNTSQDQLRAEFRKSPARHRFSSLFHTELDSFVGQIIEVFDAPKAEGVNFQFAAGTRVAFLNVIDPSSVAGAIGPFTFQSGQRSKMVPDDPGAGHPDRHWRKLASMNAAGISYREPGFGPSLHIAVREDGADVHLDREGFLNKIDGRVTYDPKQVVNHLTADLASDFVPGLVSSLTVKDDGGHTHFQASFAPWLEVNLPGTTKQGGGSRDRTEYVVGFRLFGIFSAGGG